MHHLSRPHQPSRIDYKVMCPHMGEEPTDAAGGYLILSDVGGLNNAIFFYWTMGVEDDVVDFETPRFGACHNHRQDFVEFIANGQPGQWYTISADLDWCSKTIAEVRLDGAPISRARDLSFRDTELSSIGQVRLFNYSAEVTSGWGDIKLYV